MVDKTSHDEPGKMYSMDIELPILLLFAKSCKRKSENPASAVNKNLQPSFLLHDSGYIISLFHCLLLPIQKDP